MDSLAIFIRNQCYIDQICNVLLRSTARSITERFLFPTLTVITLIVLIKTVRIVCEYVRIWYWIAKIPGAPTHPLLGHSFIVMQLDRFKFVHGTYVLIFQMFTAVNAMFGREKLSKIWAGFTPVVLLFQPEAIECLLSNTACTQKSDHYRFLQPWLGLGLVTSNNGKWKQRRKMLTPTFHFRILQDFMPIFNEHANLLVRHLDEIAQDSKSGASARDNEDIASTCRLCSIKQIKLNQESNEQSGRDAISSDLVKCACQASVSHERSNESIASDRSVDVIPIMTRCTLEVICETAMGIRLQEKQSSKEEEYVKCLHQISKLIVWRITRPWFWNDWMYRFTSEYRQFHACLKVMKSFTRDVIRQRKMDWEQKRKQDGDCSSVRMNETRQRLVFLDLLLQHHFRDPNAFTIEDIREEVDTFMFAGHDTTAMSISWVFYMLGLYPKVQDKLRDEIDQVLGDHNLLVNPTDHIDLNSEHLKQMKYLDCVLKETQRVYPTAPFFGRKLNEDTNIAGYNVPKGTSCMVLTYALHRSPLIYHDPARFIPERFLPENSRARHPYAFIPFSAGPRNCIGQKFSQLEQKIIVANVVRRFYIRSTSPEDKLIVVGEIILRPKNGLQIGFTRRFSNDD